MKTTIYTIIEIMYTIENGERVYTHTLSRGVSTDLKQAREIIIKEIRVAFPVIANTDLPYSITQYNTHNFEFRFFHKRGGREFIKEYRIFENELL